jgi:hypothetical protein
MALLVIQRPDANLYVNDPPQYEEQPYYYSRWSAAFLPLVYKISNTKFPLNTEDAVDAYTAVTNNNGFAKFDLAGTAYQTYIRGEKVTVTGTVYSGVYEVIAIQGDQLTLNVAFSETDTGTANKYYDNYATLVRLYAGVPPYHPYAAQDTMTLIGTFSIAPNPSNIAVIDVADLVRQKISKDNDLSASGRPNDLDAWTCFYIEFAETYDTGAGGIPETVITNFTVDNLQGITPISLINGSFTSNLAGWSQIKALGNGDWIWDSGSAKFPDTGVQSWSKTIYQEINLKKSIAYKLTLNYQIDNATHTRGDIRVYASNQAKGASEDILFYKHVTNDISETVVINFTPNKDLKYISFAAYVSYTSASVKVNSITLEEAIINYDTAFIFASNSTRQFFDYAKNERSRYGGNMAEYVMNYNTEGIMGKFLTRFEKPVLFPNYYQDISCILPQSTLDIPFTQDGLLYRVRTLDANGSELSSTDTEIVNNGDGVYRLRLDNKIGPGAKADLQLIRTITTPRETLIYYDLTNQSDIYYSIDGNDFEMITLAQSYLMAGISVFDNGKAVISTYKLISGSYYVVFNLFDNGTVSYIGNLISPAFAAFPFLKAFDENNFVALDTPTNQLYIRRNGVVRTISLANETVTGYRINGASMDTFFITGKPITTNQATIYELDATNSFRIFETNSQFAGEELAIAGGFIFTIRNKNGDTSNSYLSKLNAVTASETSIQVPFHDYYVDLAFENANNGFLLHVNNIYKYSNETVTTYTELNSLRTSEGDTTDYKGIQHLGEGVYVIWSKTHIYKYTGAWASLGDTSLIGELINTSFDGLYKLQTDTFQISERLPMDIDTTCTNQSMHLSWLNSLGNWEHFVFTAKKSYEKNIDDFTVSSNSVLANFPDNFDSETYDDKIKVDAFDVVTVRSQYVERKQLDIIAEILQSLRVQYWYSFDKKITVIVDSKKVSKYTDGDRLFAMEFDIIMPKTQTQS